MENELNINSDFKCSYTLLCAKLIQAKDKGENDPDEASKIDDLKSEKRRLLHEIEDSYLDRIAEEEKKRKDNANQIWAVHNKFKHTIISNDCTQCTFKFPRLLEMDNKWWIREWICFYVSERLNKNRDYYVYGDEVLKAADVGDKKFRFQLTSALVLEHLPDVIMMGKLVALLVFDPRTAEWEKMDTNSRDYISSLLSQLSSQSLMSCLCLMTSEAWRHEELIGKELNKRRNKKVTCLASTPQVTEIITIERDANGDAVAEKVAKPEGRQVDAFKKAMGEELTVVCGDGGTGKSFLMELHHIRNRERL